MAGRKPKGYELKKRLEKYLEAYELDDLNKANDMAVLQQLAQFEIIIENLQNELASIKTVGEETKKVKDLNTALRDATQSYTNLQTTLGIDRKKRQSESEESVISYIDKLKEQSKKVLDRRLKVLKCKDCKLPLMKYYVYITEVGEQGSLAAEVTEVKPIKYNVEVECPRCGKVVSIDERESSS